MNTAALEREDLILGILLKVILIVTSERNANAMPMFEQHRSRNQIEGHARDFTLTIGAESA